MERKGWKIRQEWVKEAIHIARDRKTKISEIQNQISQLEPKIKRHEGKFNT
jgi:hypothetical protein